MLSSEKVLHHIWKYKLFSFQDLSTINNESIKIISSGLHNHDAGPDFHNAKIEIDETLWVGNVEIHIKSSDWLKHQHQKDKAYDNVILHVVWEHDEEIIRSDGTIISCLELKTIVDPKLLDNYHQLKENNYWIPCETQLQNIDNFTKNQCLDRMLMERLAQKSILIKDLYEQQKGNWEETFYITLAKSFGFKVNALPFEILAKNLPQRILAKHKDQPKQIEALIFGMSGLLNISFKDDYPKQLKIEFDFLKAKYNLNPIKTEAWKFSKTRPDNFPTVRLAQFAALVLNSQHLFSQIISIQKLKDFKKLFEKLPINSYWETHYLFDKEVSNRSAILGMTSINGLLLNAIIPLLFYYGRQSGNKLYVDLVIQMLEEIKPEENQITKGFKERGFKLESAFDSQALIHLKKYFCDHKNCLNCGIGMKILKST
ncbi:MAG: DUF2851 family protein [Bacteroidetes bacterium]|nr:DUF2851 family protein [Bacteroidota bacterium]MBU1371389.1 DUF2851 family protein [Bacteroidota bacterium]MBU1485660.1 DUF2851 family protein [Bacteroidota bacterium]MBU1761908.1 DUF2851 family protein [Bacteroidota bacterium]MBU2266936.1 DUF2851 family protein [Bacteroidota bacterium]